MNDWLDIQEHFSNIGNITSIDYDNLDIISDDDREQHYNADYTSGTMRT